jgi:uroporphyrinogen decarboxylase
MTGKERISRILNHQPVDRIGVFEAFWKDTKAAYIKSGNMKDNESFENHFNLDMQLFWGFEMIADIDFKKEIVSETDETVTYLDGNGAVLRQHKLHDSTPEHIDYKLKDGSNWEYYKNLLLDEKNFEHRINFEGYRNAKKEAEENVRYFCLSMMHAFECMHRLCGHENMLIGMLLEPEWVIDMANTYAELLIKLQKILFEKEGMPDGVWYYEDMGFKEKPFMSPAKYCEIIQPAHKMTIDYNKSLNLPVIMHSCGFVEPLLPHMIEAGINCLQAIEIKAGMDLLRIHLEYGDKIALMGGIDVRALYSNDKETIDAEIQRILPFVKKGFGYILHSDHSIPNTVNYDSYKYFLEKALEVGTY